MKLTAVTISMDQVGITLNPHNASETGVSVTSCEEAEA